MLWKCLEILWKIYKYFRNCRNTLEIVEVLSKFLEIL
jgi:hypothetical protein